MANSKLKQDPLLRKEDISAAEAAQPGRFWGRGEPFVWLTGMMLTATLLITLLLLAVIMMNGLGYFWPSALVQAKLKDGTQTLGLITDRQQATGYNKDRYQFKIGNRDLYGLDFRWIDEDQIEKLTHPAEALVLERTSYGNFFGYLKAVTVPGAELAGATPWDQLREAQALVQERRTAADEIQDKITRLSAARREIDLQRLKAQHRGSTDQQLLQELAAEAREIDQQFEKLNEELGTSTSELKRISATFHDASGQEKLIPLADIVRAYRPNTMSIARKAGFYLEKIWELLSTNPRESNTEGGLFPAIFGTVMMVLLMSIFCIPLGVIAAIYLREYAREGLLVRLVRIAVNNLAGVPSIVYGIFGLGFFVYGLGSTMDKVFYPERLPEPTFGTGGLLWASLTLALLTVPVVIVATEEALAAVPRGIREGSLALGATKFQTLTRILLPMASPGIMTGLILAMARAAGEVAPLMIVGVVKLAPELLLDGEFPFLHLNRKFMHLGFHIYDVGFQSPNVEAAKPMVFVTTLLLVAIVIMLSLAAIVLRNRMRRRFTAGIF